MAGDFSDLCTPLPWAKQHNLGFRMALKSKQTTLWARTQGGFNFTIFHMIYPAKRVIQLNKVGIEPTKMGLSQRKYEFNKHEL